MQKRFLTLVLLVVIVLLVAVSNAELQMTEAPAEQAVEDALLTPSGLEYAGISTSPG